MFLTECSYTDLVALCQFLPGPASSQVGMALGLRRAGWSGALAAWLGFTLPSAIVLVLWGLGVSHWGGAAMQGTLHGLKVVAVAVVAQAVWSMARSLCPDRLRAGIALGAALLVLLVPNSLMQMGVMALGAVLGGRWLRLEAAPVSPAHPYPVGRRAGAVMLALFAALLLVLPLVAAAWHDPLFGLATQFYRAGSLVFGGGHVVLPLLQSVVVPSGLVSNDAFLAGYGAAQAVPGPLFTFAAYLGAVLPAPLGGWGGATAMLLAIFLPAWLLVVGALPFWEGLRAHHGVRRAMAGTNAAVVGVLLAALYDPVWTSAIHSRPDFALALAAFGLLVYARMSPVMVVLMAAVAGWAMQML